MLPRLKRTAAIFVAALVAFLAYHVAAVPIIEPAFPEIVPQPPLAALDPKYPDASSPLSAYFAPGSWPLDKPIELTSDKSKLLFKEYHNLDNGRVQLFPCAIVFFPNGESSAGASQRVIVLEAPQGALLQFDGPVDLQGGKFGQLQGGTMAGPVTIHGTPSRPGANDEIFADTRDVTMSTEKITTDALVNFRLGPNEGHGRQMEIRLLPSNKPATGKQNGPSVGGLESLALFRDVQMRLVPGSNGLMPLDGQRSGPKPSPAGGRAAIQPAEAQANAIPQPPVDIRCQGTFKFDMIQTVATFQDQVDVIRTFSNGPSDQMNCDRLSVYFAPKTVNPPACTTSAAAIAPPKPAGSAQRSQSLEPRRIEACGNPVIVHGDSNGVYARAEHLDYDIVSGQIALDDTQEVTLRQFSNEIHARSVVYQPGEAGRLGRLQAIGPGWLRGIPPQSAGQGPTVGGHPQSTQSAIGGITQLGLPVAPSHHPPQTAPQFFEAHWTNELKMRPHEQNHVISLTGDARAGMTGQGELAADEIHLWLKELPPTEKPVPGAPPPRWQVVADRLLAQAHVRINSPQLTGTTTRLEAWFEQAAPNVAALQSPTGANRSSPLLAASGNPSNRALPQVPASRSGPRPDNAARNPVAPAPQRYNVEGERIRIQMLSGATTTEIQDITIDGHARFGESQTPLPTDVPLLVTGNQIEVLRANLPDTGVTVSGKPAEVAARGLEMYGDIVHMDKGTNRVWIDGPGHMKLPESQPATPASRPTDSRDRIAAGRPAPSEPVSILRPAPPPEPMDVTWKDRMTFDGSTAHFEHSIVGESSVRKFQTDVLEVSLRHRIDFAQPHMDEKAEIGRIVCRGGMWMENRSFDPLDLTKLMSIDRMQTQDLMIDEVSGAILGQGPGWLTSVRRGAIDPTQPTGLTTAAKPTAMPVAQTSPDAPGKHAGSHHGAAGHGAAGQNAPADKNSLTYLHVQFTGALSGNLNQNEITFHDHVRTVNGPVLSWEDQLNPDDVDELGPGGVLLNCDQLTVRQTAAQPTAADPDHRPIELEAIGNTLVEGEVFTARANRLTYAEAKDLLVLEGDGRNDAQLFRQERPGDEAAKTAARRIFYWRSTNRVSVNDARLFDLNQLPGQDDGKNLKDPKDPKDGKKKPPKALNP